MPKDNLAKPLFEKNNKIGIIENPFCYGINWTSAMEVSIRVVNFIVVSELISNSDIWFNNKSMQIRKMLNNSNRNFTPCNICDVEGTFMGEKNSTYFN